MGLFGNSVTGFLTGGLINPSVPNYAGQAKKAEARRQALIQAGMGGINAVFGGGSAPFYTPYSTPFTKDTWKMNRPDLMMINKQGKFVPYVSSGSTSGPVADAIKGGYKGAVLGYPGSVAGATGVGAGLGAGIGSMIMPGIGTGLGALAGGLMSAFGGSPPSPRGLANKQIKQGNLFTVENKSFKGFTPNFYNKISSDYENYATPQLNRQFDDTNRSMTYGLANRGLLKSGAQTKAMGDLNVTAGMARQQVADNARGAAMTTKQQVEAARDRAIQQLYMTGDPASGMQSAISSASNFQVPQTFTPILNMFSNIAQQYQMRNTLNNASSPMSFRGGGGYGSSLPSFANSPISY